MIFVALDHFCVDGVCFQIHLEGLLGIMRLLFWLMSPEFAFSRNIMYTQPLPNSPSSPSVLIFILPLLLIPLPFRFTGVQCVAFSLHLVNPFPQQDFSSQGPRNLPWEVWLSL